MATSYSYARDHLAELWDKAEDEREPVVIQRRGHEDMALIPAAELRSLRETAYLLRSPANAERLLRALVRSRQKGGEAFGTTAELALRLGLNEAGG
jgi:antitoxin YefM